MRILLEYDQTTGQLFDAKSMYVGTYAGATGFEQEKQSSITLDLIKQGVTPDEIIKLKNNDLI